MSSDKETASIGIDKRHALVLLIKEMLDQLDEVASIKKRGGSAALSMELLREMSSVLKDLPEDLQKAYLETLVSLSTQSPAPRKRSLDDEYVKAAAAVKRQFMLRLRQDLDIAV